MIFPKYQLERQKISPKKKITAIKGEKGLKIWGKGGPPNLTTILKILFNQFSMFFK